MSEHEQTIDDAEAADIRACALKKLEDEERDRRRVVREAEERRVRDAEILAACDERDRVARERDAAATAELTDALGRLTTDAIGVVERAVEELRPLVKRAETARRAASGKRGSQDAEPFERVADALQDLMNRIAAIRAVPL